MSKEVIALLRDLFVLGIVLIGLSIYAQSLARAPGTQLIAHEFYVTASLWLFGIGFGSLVGLTIEALRIVLRDGEDADLDLVRKQQAHGEAVMASLDEIDAKLKGASPARSNFID